MKNQRKYTMQIRVLCCKGFTLVEVLVSVFILSIGFILMMQALQISVLAIIKSRDSIRASSLLAEKLNDKSNPYGKLRAEGRFEDPYSAYSWSIKRHDIFSNDHQPQVVSATVWRDGSQTRHTLSTLKLRE